MPCLLRYRSGLNPCQSGTRIRCDGQVSSSRGDDDANRSGLFWRRKVHGRGRACPPGPGIYRCRRRPVACAVRWPGRCRGGGTADGAGPGLACPAQLGMGSGPPGRADPGRSASDAVRLRRCGQPARAGRPLRSGVPAGDRRAHDAGTTGCAPGLPRLGPRRGYSRVPAPQAAGIAGPLARIRCDPIDARQPTDQVVDAILSRTLPMPALAKPGMQPGGPARP